MTRSFHPSITLFSLLLLLTSFQTFKPTPFSIYCSTLSSAILLLSLIMINPLSHKRAFFKFSTHASIGYLVESYHWSAGRVISYLVESYHWWAGLGFKLLRVSFPSECRTFIVFHLNFSLILGRIIKLLLAKDLSLNMNQPT